eukprot:366301-Chlamydomonas_euryale.AAC.48
MILCDTVRRPFCTEADSCSAAPPRRGVGKQQAHQLRASLCRPETQWGRGPSGAHFQRLQNSQQQQQQQLQQQLQQQQQQSIHGHQPLTVNPLLPVATPPRTHLVQAEVSTVEGISKNLSVDPSLVAGFLGQQPSMHRSSPVKQQSVKAPRVWQQQKSEHPDLLQQGAVIRSKDNDLGVPLTVRQQQFQSESHLEPQQFQSESHLEPQQERQQQQQRPQQETRSHWLPSDEQASFNGEDVEVEDIPLAVRQTRCLDALQQQQLAQRRPQLLQQEQPWSAIKLQVPVDDNHDELDIPLAVRQQKTPQDVSQQQRQLLVPKHMQKRPAQVGLHGSLPVLEMPRRSQSLPMQAPLRQQRWQQPEQTPLAQHLRMQQQRQQPLPQPVPPLPPLPHLPRAREPVRQPSAPSWEELRREWLVVDCVNDARALLECRGAPDGPLAALPITEVERRGALSTHGGIARGPAVDVRAACYWVYPQGDMAVREYQYRMVSTKRARVGRASWALAFA